MLEVCRQKSFAKNLSPNLYHQFLQEMAFEKKYALIFIPSGSFGLITDVEEAKKCLRILYEHLLPEGKLLFEALPVGSLFSAICLHPNSCSVCWYNS